MAAFDALSGSQFLQTATTMNGQGPLKPNGRSAAEAMKTQSTTPPSTTSPLGAVGPGQGISSLPPQQQRPV